MSKFLFFLKNLFLLLFTFGKKGSFNNTISEKKGPKEPLILRKPGEPAIKWPWSKLEIKSDILPSVEGPFMGWTKESLLKPNVHRRYISLYCIADLEDGDVSIKTTRGKEIWRISERSLKRLTMEGTGRLSNGKVVNVSKMVNGVWRYSVMSSRSPNGVGIRNKALIPWVSMAHHLGQLRVHSLFGKSVVVPELRGYKTPDGLTLDGVFEICDTGGGLRKCPYVRSLWRTGATKKEYGQFDLFIGGPESMYKGLLG
ncbi:MAG: hypothetical protein KAS32_06475, partial [Candidatus Peribacteraceae bacterium]|nr:hypothetical protein [Candidatus Peribacteraceae bacterium]